MAHVRPRYRWLYVYAFLRPNTGESEFWLLPSVSTEVFNLVLSAFAQLRGSGEGLGLVYLPPYSPELQPVERVWPLVDAVVANGQVGTEEELWERVESRCAYLQTQRELIRNHTLFHWWPGGC